MVDTSTKFSYIYLESTINSLSSFAQISFQCSPNSSIRESQSYASTGQVGRIGTFSTRILFNFIGINSLSQHCDLLFFCNSLGLQRSSKIGVAILNSTFKDSCKIILNIKQFVGNSHAFFAHYRITLSVKQLNTLSNTPFVKFSMDSGNTLRSININIVFCTQSNKFRITFRNSLVNFGNSRDKHYIVTVSQT